MRGATLDRSGTPVAAAIARTVKPVMLLTVNVPFDRVAVDFAVETAVQTGAELYICTAVPIAVGNPASHVARSFGDGVTKADSHEVAEYAKDLGVRTTQLVFHNPKPVNAALDVIRDTGVGLVVFGADRSHMNGWSFRRMAKRIRRDACCLVWTNEDARPA